jgi:hypothetical protein
MKKSLQISGIDKRQFKDNLREAYRIGDADVLALFFINLDKIVKYQ